MGRALFLKVDMGLEAPPTRKEKEKIAARAVNVFIRYFGTG